MKNVRRRNNNISEQIMDFIDTMREYGFEPFNHSDAVWLYCEGDLDATFVSYDARLILDESKLKVEIFKAHDIDHIKSAENSEIIVDKVSAVRGYLNDEGLQTIYDREMTERLVDFVTIEVHYADGKQKVAQYINELAEDDNISDFKRVISKACDKFISCSFEAAYIMSGFAEYCEKEAKLIEMNI